MTLSPTERAEVLRMVAENLTAELLRSLDLDELATLELGTSAQLLGLGSTQAAKYLDVIEVGRRTRRVTVKDHKAFIEERRKAAPTRKTA